MAATKDAENAERYQQWYDPDVTEVNPHIRHLLEAYSLVVPKDVVNHVNHIRSLGFSATPYPCIGHYRFLNLTLLTHPLYEAILSRLKSNPEAQYLDLGCCFGQDLRQLVLDGVPSNQLTGIDIEGPLMELGYGLFLDKKSLKSRFLVTDIFKGKVDTEADVVHCSAFFHLFPLPQQIEAAKIIARLVRPGGIIVGRQSGSVKPGEVPAIKAGSTSFRHDVTTLKEMWDQVGEETATKWSVDGHLDEVGIDTTKKNAVEDENSRRLLFTITREE